MQQHDVQSDLLQEVIEEFINTGKMPVPTVFRAHHAERIPEINDLQARQLLQYQGGAYKVPLSEFQKSKFWPRERRIANKILGKLKSLYRSDPTRFEFPANLALPGDEPGLVALDISRVTYYLKEAGFLRADPRFDATGKCEALAPDESVLLFDDIDAKLADQLKVSKRYQELKSGTSPFSSLIGFPVQTAESAKSSRSVMSVNDLWKQIEKDCGDSKLQFARRINFVKGTYAREVIFRDIAHAQGCLMNGFYKPATILAGGVIEELLRQYLISKGYPPKPKKESFHEYIEACREHGLIKRALVHLTGGVKDFRNLVHLKEESSRRHAISRSAAAGAIHAIFTLAHDFE
ncbi:hypothetical protein KGO95_03580 [Patescibacteria group bacterium]|nr:hypothetical protein [Patescibacteria group bacterium]